MYIYHASLALHKAGLSSNPSGHWGMVSHTCSRAMHVGELLHKNGLSSSQGLLYVHKVVFLI
jgi:hypothetical protein